MNIYDQIYNEKLGELIKDIPFPESDISSEFVADVMAALKHCTDTSLSCSLDEYEQVYNTALNDSKWFLPEMFVAIQAVTSVNPTQLGYSALKWVNRKRLFIAMLAEWDTIAAPYKDEARKFAEDKARRDKRELEAKSKLVQLNGKQLHAK